MLKLRGIETALLDPTEDFTASTEGFQLRAVVFEPFFVLDDRSTHFKPILDRILERAKQDNAVRIALSTQDTEYISRGYTLGIDYDYHVRKPSHLDQVLELIP